MSSSDTNNSLQGVAIIGMAGRFPKARNLDELWQNLIGGVESITTFTDEELKAAGIDPAVINAPNYVKAGGVLDEVELFDASFFGFSPREAEIMDPQYRLFLEKSWEAIEVAGYVPDAYDGVIGIFGGMSMSTYLLNNILTNRNLMESEGALQIRILNDKDFLVSLAAYKLNLRGPSITVQSACSTSLVATCLACQSLLSYQCDMALAGGVSVSAPSRAGYFSREGVFSPDGHCRAFDSRAAGTVVGNGVGVVVLKRLEDAIADGDNIQAVIKGSAINNDGSLKVGFTAPSVDGQAEVIAMAQALAQVAPETVTYVEAHGTATPMGDPIEIAALTQVFSAGTDKKNFCAVGSVKTNIGHLDAAAGIASLIKTVLALEHKKLPPSLHFENPNPAIGLADTPFYVNASPVEWNRDDSPRRAGVSAFAVGGVNAHLVVEEAPEPEPSGASRPLQLLLVSAKTRPALETATENLLQYLKANRVQNLADIAYTLQTGRNAFNFRRALVCHSTDDAIDALETRDPRRILQSDHEAIDRGIVFMFPGLGNHYANMAAELYRFEPFFREQVDLSCQILEPHLGVDLREVMYPGFKNGGMWSRQSDPESASRSAGLDLRKMLRRSKAADESNAELNRTIFAQPAIFVIEHALARLLIKWGIEPQAMVGYSLGEYVAACVAEVISLEDSLMLVAKRARMIQQLPRGSMLAVPLSETEIKPALEDGLSLAAVNGPGVCVVSGRIVAVSELERNLAARGLACRRLPTEHAFHSKMMEPIRGELTRLAKSVKLSPPKIPYLSNVTGTWITPEEATDPNHWATHICGTVRFESNIKELSREKNLALVEVGPGQALGAWVMQHPDNVASRSRVVLASMRHDYDTQSDLAQLLATVGRLWLAGSKINWQGFVEGERRRRVPLPTYPFERKRYWIEPHGGSQDRVSARILPVKKQEIAEWFYVPVWKQSHPAVANDSAGPQRWLIFADEFGTGDQLIERLSAMGHVVSSVRAGGQFARLEPNAYTIDPVSPDDYISLMTDLMATGEEPSRIVHLWSVGPGSEKPDGADSADEWQQKGFFSLLALAQALGSRTGKTPLDIVVISSQMQQVTGDEAVCLEKATLLGPCQVIPQEYPNITCRSIDIGSPKKGKGLSSKVVEQLTLELLNPSSDEVVAYRGGRRWVQTFESISLGTAGEKRKSLRDGSVWFITGGTGGIGLTLAGYIAETVHSKLALVGRTEFPARERWSEWLAANGEFGDVSRRIRKIQELEAKGAEVLVLKADVTKVDQVRDAVAETVLRLGAINGVIHAAGAPPGGMIQMKTPESAGRILDPKVKGTRALAEALHGAQLDYFVLCSSLTSIVGGFGMVDHAGANAFLNAFADQHWGKTSLPVISINWDAWLEVGQAAGAKLSSALREIVSGEEGRRIGHPLLERCIGEGSQQETYITQMSTTRHWVLDEHRIMQQGVLPGTAYLEMIRKAFEKRAGQSAIVLKDVILMKPLMITDGQEQEVHTTLTERGESMEFLISSKSASGNNEWYHHVKGSVYAEAVEPSDKYDIQDILARCEEMPGLGSGSWDEGAKPDSFVRFGKRWQNLYKKIHIGTGEVLAEIELPDAFVSDLETFLLHPSLMDAATGFIQIAGGGFHVPMSYGKVRIKASLPKKIYSYARANDEAFAGKETVACDIVIMDQQGRALVEVEDFVVRRVEDMTGFKGSSSQREREADTGGAPLIRPSGPYAKQETPPAITQVGIKTGIRPAEGAEAFGRILSMYPSVPQIVVCTKDLPALIERTQSFAQTDILEELARMQSQRQKHARPEVSTEYVPPGTELERRLVALWQETLNLDKAGIYDNFFEMGGDSLLATQLIARVGEGFEISLSLRTLFEAPTVADLAVVIVQKRAEQTDAEALAQVLGEIKGLSLEDQQTMLAAEKQA